jgi:hypothetical protein
MNSLGNPLLTLSGTIRADSVAIGNSQSIGGYERIINFNKYQRLPPEVKLQLFYRKYNIQPGSKYFQQLKDNL